MKTHVKICGIKSVESALFAIDAGADFVGLNFVPTSKRNVSVETATTIVAAIQGQVKVVGVFQDAEASYVNEVAEKVHLDFVQLHGNEDPAYCDQMESDVIKGISIKADESSDTVMSRMKMYDVPFFLVDREIQGEGQLVNSVIAEQIAKEFEVFLAGGLNPENVARIVKDVKPFAVDVAGGIETDGEVDEEKIKQFILNAKGVEL